MNVPVLASIVQASSFPAIDPIPLPAPVWLFKVFHDLTLTLHFAALHLLIGGLLLATVWNFLGQMRSEPDRLLVSASGVVATRLTIVMTYVINLGIPPLLFVQVLYGRAVYTGTVLIGPIWLSVVLAVIVAYFLLYRVSKLAVERKPWWIWGLAALAVIEYVGHVYATAMTLMLRPEVWPAMYDANPTGAHLPPFDPTKWPRFAMIMVGSVGFGAIGSALYSAKRNLPEDVKTFLRVQGGRVGLAALVVLAGVGLWAFNTQPDFVREGLLASVYYKVLLCAWVAFVVLAAVAAVGIQACPGSLTLAKGLFASLAATLAVASYVLIREGVRDLTLAAKGFDVWLSPVNTNWTVVVLFVVSLVLGLIGVGWLIAVLRGAKPTEERYV